MGKQSFIYLLVVNGIKYTSFLLGILLNEQAIEKLIHGWREAVSDAAKAKANVVYLTEFRKSKKAILIQEAESAGLKTGQERESYAYAHVEYQMLLEALRDATQEHEELRNRMLIAQTRIDIWRTQQANNRKEFASYGN